MIALDPNGTFPYVLRREQQLPREQQTILRLRVLRGAELEAFTERIREGEPTPSEAETMVRIGIRGWSNLTDESGAAVRCGDLSQVQFLGRQFQALSEADFARLPLGVQDLTEVLQATIAGNTLSVLDAKK